MNRSLKSFVAVYVLALGALGLMASQASALVRCSPANVTPITGIGASTVISSSYPTTFIGQAIMISYNAECSIGGALIIPQKIVALNESAVIQGVSIDSGGTDARRYGNSVGG